jgi:hypothetical protein
VARFEVEGLDIIVEDMKRKGELAGETAERMLLAGAEEVKQAWKGEAERRKFRDTSAMINSIGFPRSVKRASDIMSIDIYPQGKDKKGTRNAEKAFILHWGTTSSAAQKRRKKKKFSGPGIPRTLWVDDADRASGPRVMDAFTRIWDAYLKGRK